MKPTLYSKTIIIKTNHKTCAHYQPIYNGCQQYVDISESKIDSTV